MSPSDIYSKETLISPRDQGFAHVKPLDMGGRTGKAACERDLSSPYPGSHPRDQYPGTVESVKQA
ncbi:MAG: hypothetical protein QW496_03520 [Desulfurococcaceae archaeon]